MPSDSRLGARSGRDWAAAIFAWLFAVLALNPVHDLMKSVDRTSIRSLLKLGRLIFVEGDGQAADMELQPESSWTINRTRWAPTSSADSGAHRIYNPRPLASNQHTLSRAPDVAESPTPRISATHDETRATDQCGAARDARRDSGGRRAR